MLKKKNEYGSSINLGWRSRASHAIILFEHSKLEKWWWGVASSCHQLSLSLPPPPPPSRNSPPITPKVVSFVFSALDLTLQFLSRYSIAADCKADFLGVFVFNLYSVAVSLQKSDGLIWKPALSLIDKLLLFYISTCWPSILGNFSFCNG